MGCTESQDTITSESLSLIRKHKKLEEKKQDDDNDIIYNLYSNMSQEPVWISDNTILYDTQIINKQYLNSKNNLPIVLIHDIFSTLNSWYPFMEYLYNSKEYQNKIQKQSFILISLKGRGGTQYYPNYDYKNEDEISKTWSYDTLTTEIVQVLKTLGLSKYHICGHAFGSLITLKLAINNPNNIASLFLIGTTVNWDEMFKKKLLSSYSRKSVEKFGNFRGFAQTYLPQFLMGGGDYEYFTKEELTKRWTYTLNIHYDIVDSFSEIFKYDIIDDIKILNQSKMNIFILQGEKDVITPVSRLGPLLDGLSTDQLTFVKLPNAGHYMAFQSVFYQDIAKHFIPFFLK